ncbi:hypothetical protein EJ02DRAFT_494542 [Clathrospora elynae]|uniref:Uncharacterized protein n=1 Tax=Clathrospora elynae TaxID=706981 RepID=A0A6A5SU80_9PLEO|nr:hypothetical protein EJ02DRAFT_494542 [Clathrospora elynae]
MATPNPTPHSSLSRTPSMDNMKSALQRKLTTIWEDAQRQELSQPVDLSDNETVYNSDAAPESEPELQVISKEKVKKVDKGKRKRDSRVGEEEQKQAEEEPAVVYGPHPKLTMRVRFSLRSSNPLNWGSGKVDDEQPKKQRRTNGDTSPPLLLAQPSAQQSSSTLSNASSSKDTQAHATKPAPQPKPKVKTPLKGKGKGKAKAKTLPKAKAAPATKSTEPAIAPAHGYTTRRNKPLSQFPIIQKHSWASNSPEYSDSFWIEDHTFHMGFWNRIPLQQTDLNTPLAAEGPKAAWKRLFPDEGEMSKHKDWKEKMLWQKDDEEGNGGEWVARGEDEPYVRKELGGLGPALAWREVLEQRTRKRETFGEAYMSRVLERRAKEKEARKTLIRGC